MARRPKPINLPRITADDVDIAHILEGHTKGGARAGSSKTLFPDGWHQREVLAAVLGAYRAGKRVETQVGRLRVVGTSHGVTIEM